MTIKNWNIEEMTGYKPMTTFYTDFSIADRFGIKAIKDTYNKCFKDFKNDYKYLTELSLAMNWKSWEHKDNKEICKLYCDLYYEIDDYCWNNFNEEEKNYYYRVTN